MNSHRPCFLVVAGAGTLALVGGIDDDGSDGGDDEQDDNEAFGRRARILGAFKVRVLDLCRLYGVIGNSDDKVSFGRQMQ